MTVETPLSILMVSAFTLIGIVSICTVRTRLHWFLQTVLVLLKMTCLCLWTWASPPVHLAILDYDDYAEEP